MALLRLRNFTVRLAFVALSAVVVHANADEYQVKAAFLYNFAKFVEWPPDVFESSDSPIGVCVVGQNLFGHALAEIVSGRIVNRRSFLVRQISDIKQASHCQILFVSSSERMRYGAILRELRTGVLTVGETEGFIEEGGVVNLKLDGGKVQIQVNINAADQAGVRISSKLLSLAQIIRKPAQAK
jgi:hypothetical protein